MAKYWVTGVWKDASGKLTHLYLHLTEHGRWQKGEKTSEKLTMLHLDRGAEIYTMRWDYEHAAWVPGARVVAVEYPNSKDRYLTSTHDFKLFDSLDHMLEMDRVV